MEQTDTSSPSIEEKTENYLSTIMPVLTCIIIKNNNNQNVLRIFVCSKRHHHVSHEIESEVRFVASGQSDRLHAYSLLHPQAVCGSDWLKKMVHSGVGLLYVRFSFVVSILSSLIPRMLFIGTEHNLQRGGGGWGGGG